jgi:hypothetical protein
MTTKAIFALVLLICVSGALGVYLLHDAGIQEQTAPQKALAYQPRQDLDTGGFMLALMGMTPWSDGNSLEDIQKAFDHLAERNIQRIDAEIAQGLRPEQEIQMLLIQAALFLYDGHALKAYGVLEAAREKAEATDNLSKKWLYTIVFFQGVAGLRRGETENCIDCRGEGACIFPLRPTAVHANPTGSGLAIKHFTEYLQQFPEDQSVRWLLNLAYMTLGEHPGKVPPEYLLTFDRFGADLDIGRFKDIGHLVGVNRLNMAGGAIMDDFDNDGLLDLIVSTWDAHEGMAFYRNKGDGTFEDRSEAAGLTQQVAGFNIVQTDYNNDGNLDIFVMRGGWMRNGMRPSLLRNNGDGTFTDVTQQAGLMEPINTMAAVWADYDNDGWLDLFICCERGPNRLYRNHRDGTFEEVAFFAGVRGKDKTCKGAAWIDYDNDGWPDLFVTYLQSTPQLFHNNRDGTFTDVTDAMGITGPKSGFSCWAFDYDNDGWLDIFATCYDRSLDSLVRNMQGEPPPRGIDVTRLYRNLGGKEFQDVSKETGVDKVFATMGSNFADFDNDGYLDFYLATGDAYLETLVPNRMFKNIGGKRFADITATSGTGHLQKGHGVACGDWRRDGNVDLFIELGGALPGDRYHNALFQNPGHGNDWLTVKLIGKKTNRAAIGARIKVVTAGDNPLTVHRHISSGSSFGANPLQQTIGLGRTTKVATLEIFWPTSQTKQVFHDIDVDQAIEVTEFAENYRKLNWKRVPVPK